MKQNNKYNQTFSRFNFIFFLVLSTLGLILIVFSIINLTTNKLTKHAKTDFENELMGQAYFASLNQNYGAEINLYKILLNRLPEMEAELSFKIGKALFNQGDFINAIEEYDKALKLNYPDSCEVFLNIAMTFHKLKKYELAVKYYKKASESEYYAADANFNLGNVYFFQLNEEALALIAYKKSIKTPTLLSGYYDMLWRERKVYSKRKNPEIFELLASELVSEKEDNFFGKYYKAEFQKMKPEKNQAVIHNYIGIIYAQNDDETQALSHFRKAMIINPDFDDARHNYQKTFQKLNSINGIKNLEKQKSNLNL